MTTDIVHLCLSICFIILAIDNGIRRRRERRVVQKIQEIHEQVYPGDSMYATKQIAEAMGVKLDGND